MNNFFHRMTGKKSGAASPVKTSPLKIKYGSENVPPEEANVATAESKTPLKQPKSLQQLANGASSPPRSASRHALLKNNDDGVSVDSGVKLIVRIRPLRAEEQEQGQLIARRVSEDSVSVEDHQFTFDAVAGVDATQEEVFDLVGIPLVENCLAGYNSSIFAYGQTGSGKTYTMYGPSIKSSSHQGITPRVFKKLFERIQEEEKKHADKKLHYFCRCSFLEIYNEQITDLLEPSQRNLLIREDINSGVFVENITEESVESIDDVSRLLLQGLANRRTGSTSINAESSRSHSIFTCVLELHYKNLTDGSKSVRKSRINLVDLAGSERQRLTGAAGDRLKEAGNINRSLSQLGNLINILAEVSQGKQRHIPYRDSRLTFLLQESLGGNAKLAMICNISPAESCKSETLSTLRFAKRAKAIKNKAIVNEEKEEDVNALREQIRLLKEEVVRMRFGNSPVPSSEGAYATGSNARKSLNLLRESLNHPSVFQAVNSAIDEETETDEKDLEKKSSEHEDPANGPTESLAVSLQRGLKIIDTHGHKQNSSVRWSTMRVSTMSMPAANKADVGIQASLEQINLPPSSNDSKCDCRCHQHGKKSSSGTEVQDESKWQLIPYEGATNSDESSHLNHAVRRVLAGAIRREQALEEYCNKQATEIEQLNQLIEQYKHERECNSIMQQTKEEKLLRFEDLIEGALPAEEFQEQEFASLKQENEILKSKCENHPEVLRTKIEEQQMAEELEKYRKFCDLGERETLIQEIQNLRNQLQSYMESGMSTADFRKWQIQSTMRLLQGPQNAESDQLPTEKQTNPPCESPNECDQDEWIARETEWINLAESLRADIDSYRRLAEKRHQECEFYKRSSDEVKQSMEKAMDAHGQLLHNFCDLQDKHVALLARHKQLKEGIEDVQRAAVKKGGGKGKESRIIKAQAAQIAVIQLERERERKRYTEQIKTLHAQLSDTAEAVQAAGELLVRLKEAEENILIARETAAISARNTENVRREMEKLNRKHEIELAVVNQELAETRAGKSTVCSRCKANGTGKYDFSSANKRDDYEPFSAPPRYDDDFSRPTDHPSSWFTGYDRCNL